MATAVVGAGGPTGLECVKQLLAGASVPEVRAVVRDVAKHQDRFPKR
ncbi:NAD(P)-bd_dom domain-containing protein, partial [Haematococcus lacustris]